MREEGGGAGSLDRMGVLAEEKLNMAGDGDPFKRQLRYDTTTPDYIFGHKLTHPLTCTIIH